MKRPALWLASFVMLLTVLVCATAARATACPVMLEWFWIGATGSKHDSAQYDVQVKAAVLDRYAVRFSVVGGTNDMKHTIQVSGIDMEKTHEALLTFAWPTATLGAVAIKDVTQGDGTRIQCADAPPVAVLNSKDEAKSSFDDGAVPWPSEVVGSAIPFGTMTDARATQMIAPDYPNVDRYARHEGTVIVAVSVGPDGRPVEVTIFKSSGYSTLDKAALEAARRCLYEPPTLNGTPYVAKYLQQYVFKVQ
jgi:TonB family protein